MTRENDIRDKARAVFLTALMVMSVVAMTASFSGAAVALNDGDINNDDYDAGPIERQDDVGTEVDNFDAWQGQRILIELTDAGVSEGDTIQVRKVTDASTNPISLSGVRSSSTVEEIEPANGVFEQYVIIRTGTLEEGDYVLKQESGNYLDAGDAGGAFGANANNAAQFGVSEQDLSMQFENDDPVNVGDSAGFTVESNRGGSDITIEEADGQLDENDLDNLFSQITAINGGTSTGDANVTLQNVDAFSEETLYFDENNATDFDEGEYTFTAEVDDTEAEDTFSIELEEEIDSSAEFVAPQYNVATGDTAAITISTTGDPNYVFLKVGDNTDFGYQSNVTINPDGEDLTVPLFVTSSTADADQFNYDGAQTDQDDAFLTLAESDPEDDGDDEVVRVDRVGTELDNVIQPGQYDMEVGVSVDNNDTPETSDVDFDDLEEDDVATLNVQERSTNELNTWTVPGQADWDDAITQDANYGSDNIDPYTTAGNLTQTDQIAVTDDDRLDTDQLRSANGDWITAQVDVSGVYGVLSGYDAASQDLTSSAYIIEHGDLPGRTSGTGAIGGDGQGPFFPGVMQDDLKGTQLNGLGAGTHALQNNTLQFNITQVEPDPNKPPYVLNASAKDNFQMTRDDANTNLYFTANADNVWFDRESVANLNDRNAGPNPGSSDVKNASELTGEEFEVSFNVTNTYLETFTRDSLSGDDSEVVVDTFEFVDREATWNGVDDDDTIRMPAQDGATVSGQTTIAPGTEITVRARGSGQDPFLETTKVNVTEDRTFEAQFPFAERTQGQNFTLSIRNQGFDDDAEIDAQIGDAPAPANFNVADLSPESAEVEPGTEIDVSATVSNDGDQEDTQTIELRLDGETLDSSELTLAGGASETVEFTGVAAPDEEGDYTHSIASNDSEASGTLTVATPQPADFQVSNLDPAEATVAPGDSVDVSATVENAGDEEATKTVEIRLDGETVDSEDVTLAGGDSTDVSFSATAPDEAGDYTHSVWTEDSEADGTLTVEAEDMDGEDGEDGEDGTDGEDGEDGADGEDGTDGEDGGDQADGEGPGFGVVVALLAFLGAALLAARRNE